jgi:hypothetical protein
VQLCGSGESFHAQQVLRRCDAQILSRIDYYRSREKGTGEGSSDEPYSGAMPVCFHIVISPLLTRSAGTSSSMADFFDIERKNRPT